MNRIIAFLIIAVSAVCLQAAPEPTVSPSGVGGLEMVVSPINGDPIASNIGLITSQFEQFALMTNQQPCKNDAVLATKIYLTPDHPEPGVGLFSNIWARMAWRLPSDDDPRGVHTEEDRLKTQT